MVFEQTVLHHKLTSSDMDRYTGIDETVKVFCASIMTLRRRAADGKRAAEYSGGWLSTQ